jgi:PAS domain S-box-containing protein
MADLSENANATKSTVTEFDGEAFALIAGCLKEGVLVQGSDGRITWHNPRAADLLGLTEDALRGKYLDALAFRCEHEDGTAFAMSEFPATVALRTGVVQSDIVMGVRRPNDEMVWLLVSSTLLPVGNGVATTFVDITEFKRTERLLETVHARDNGVLDAANVAIVATDSNGVVHTYNACAERMLGYRRDAVIGKPLPIQVFDKYEVASRALQLTLGSGLEVLVHEARAGRCETREWTCIRKDGIRFSVALTVSAIRDPAESIVGFVGVAEDITERKRDLHELQKLALVASRTHNLVVVTDAVAHVEWVNDAFTRVTGYSLEDVKGRKIGPLVQGPDTDPAVIRTMREAIAKGEGFQVEVLNYDKHGRTYWLEIDCRPFHSFDGSLQGFIAVEAEITARKKMEAQLRENEARLRALVEALPDMVFRLSCDGVFVDVHAPHEELLLLPRDVFIGRRAIDVMPPEITNTLSKATERARLEMAPQVIEYRLELRDVPRDYEARIVPGLGTDFLVVVRDVSERKTLDLLKNEFISTVSHELRTPLTAIQGTLGLLSGGVLGPLGTEARELVGAALTNTERLSRLINDILDLDRVTRQGFELQIYPQELMPLIERAINESAMFAAEFEVAYVVEEVSRTAKASVDADRFMQVMNNLLSNAAKYGNSQDVVHVGIERTGDFWRVYVRNRGAPIPDSFRRRVFSRFAVLDGTDMRSRHGTGLGLAITKSLVERMGGQIDYLSTTESTEFFLTLPVL